MASPDRRPGRTARCAVVLSFDLDAESGSLYRDPANADRPVLISHGRFGPRRGVPNLLTLLRVQALPATFFVPAWVAEHYPDAIAAIVAAGHEVGAHGSLYSSNMMDDYHPYRHPTPPGARPLIELPIQWLLDDAPFFWPRPDLPRPIQPNGNAHAIWSEEFTAIHQRGGLFVLTMHPRIIGRPSRVDMLARLIDHIRQHEGVWANGAPTARRITPDRPPGRRPQGSGASPAYPCLLPPSPPRP